PTLRRGCGPPRPISTSRRPRGCVTRSSACAPPSSRCSTIPPPRRSRSRVLLPLPACGERVGVRGTLHARKLVKIAAHANPPSRKWARVRPTNPSPTGAARARPPAAPACAAAGDRAGGDMPRVVGIDHLGLGVGDFARSKEFYRQLLGFLGFKLKYDYADMAGWSNGKTLFWIAAADAQGRKRKYRKGDIGFHHYAFELSSRKDVDA